MDIRRARTGDIPQLLSLIRRYWDFEGIEGFAALRIELVLKELLEGPLPRGSIWVAESHGTLAGYLIVVHVMSVEHQGLMAEIDEFFVLPESRAHGIGTRLLAAAEAELAQHGCVRLQLQLALGNRRARAFYERLGFGARPGYELLDKPLG
ncbi:MAG TPA: GNAT family N-acetyltransferase [Steroidobacteraceae bacterium]|jgi:GNAT superfamily N-acetyltransferase